MSCTHWRSTHNSPTSDSERGLVVNRSQENRFQPSTTIAGER